MNYRKIVIFVYLLFFCFYDNTMQLCDISFPVQTHEKSTKFSVTTNRNREAFENITVYMPGKIYDITISINNEPPEQKLTFEELFFQTIQISDKMRSSNESPYQSPAQILVNNTGLSDFRQCSSGFKATLCCDLARKFVFNWISPHQLDGCIKILISVKLKNLPSNKFEQYQHVLCGPKETSQDIMPSDQSATFGCTTKVNPDPAKKCNIGSTALYRMTIENNWKPLKHWKDWPGVDGYVPKLTQYLGVSHSKNFNLYHIGGIASTSVRHLCTNGSFTNLEKLFYKSGNEIQSIIMTRSLEATPESPKRSALVTVNSTFHLISFLSHLVPSPDWCTGLSRFDLCSGQCNWPETVTEYMYPWDAGVYSGESYLSTKESESRSSICPITATWPKDNPFTKVDGMIQNIGIVTFRLLQEYNVNQRGSCNSYNKVYQDEGHYREFQSELQTKTYNCVFSEWSEWSICSNSCGRGHKIRYKRLIDGSQDECTNEPLKEVKNCYHVCRDQCLSGFWSEWSMCNATCFHHGVIYRTKLYSDEEEKVQCSGYTEVTQKEICHISASRCVPSVVCEARPIAGESCDPADNYMRFQFEISTGTCQQYNGCHGGLNNFLTKQDCESMCNKYYDDVKHQKSRFLKNPCRVPTNSNENCISKIVYRRWHFDKSKQICYQFSFVRCQDGGNGFNTKHECESHCLSKMNVNSSGPENDECSYLHWSSWTSCTPNCPSTRTRVRQVIPATDKCNDIVTQTETCPSIACQNAQPCKYSPWSVWSACSVTCGKGFRERVRVKLSYDCLSVLPQYSEREICHKDC